MQPTICIGQSSVFRSIKAIGPKLLLQINSTIIAGLLVLIAIDSLGTTTYSEIRQDYVELNSLTEIMQLEQNITNQHLVNLFNKRFI